MFNYCWSLSSLPEITKWNTRHLENNENMFKGCDELIDKPIIERKNKGFFGNLFG